jgi:hypothetical protein
VNVKLDLRGKTDESQLTLRQSLHASLQEMHEYKEQLLKEVDGIDLQLEQGQSPVRLIVEVNEDGSVTGINRMLAEDATAAAAGKTA